MNALDQITPTSTIEEVQQAAFTVVVCGLRAQGWQQSLHPTLSACAWFGRDDMRCALGHLMKDSPVKGVGHTTDHFYPPLKAWWVASPEQQSTLSLGFMDRLRRVHDSSVSPEVMEQRMREAGEYYNLRWPEEEALDGNHNS